jgi:hypothetical protein
MTDIRKDIAARIAEINPQVSESVVSAIVSREVEKRSNAIVQGLDKLRDLERDLKKIKPDQVTYDVDGKVKDESWSQGQLKSLTEARQKIKKLTDAIDKALGGDIGDLNNVNGKG